MTTAQELIQQMVVVFLLEAAANLVTACPDQALDAEVDFWAQKARFR